MPEIEDRQETEHESFDAPGEVREFPHGKVEILSIGGGEVGRLPSGHDAWVEGDEPVVVVDWYGASNYAKGG
ncbi:MAG TPA: hypothetical protein VK279_07315 [Solirubrobacteraceae bacterium]|nr:hypothetical protein [Solirubrobacteraceae bacterium]